MYIIHCRNGKTLFYEGWGRMVASAEHTFAQSCWLTIQSPFGGWYTYDNGKECKLVRIDTRKVNDLSWPWQE